MYILLLVPWLLVSPAGAGDPEHLRQAEVDVRSQVPEPLAEVLAEAERAGLPTRGLALKAVEGVAKGVPVDRVEQVLRQLLESQAQAKAILESAGPEAGPSEEEIVAGGAALRAGASAAGLREVASGPFALRARSLHSLADLLRLGMPEAEVVRLIALASRGDASTLSGLASAASALVAAGASPLEASHALGRAVAEDRALLSAIPVDVRGPKEHIPDVPDGPVAPGVPGPGGAGGPR